MKREHLITYLRVAGYHEDRSTFTRLYIENKISKAKADEAFREGRAMKAAGVRCTCHECRVASPSPSQLDREIKQALAGDSRLRIEKQKVCQIFACLASVGI